MRHEVDAWANMVARSRRHFKCIFLRDNHYISIQISSKFIAKCPIGKSAFCLGNTIA